MTPKILPMLAIPTAEQKFPRFSDYELDFLHDLEIRIHSRSLKYDPDRKEWFFQDPAVADLVFFRLNADERFADEFSEELVDWTEWNTVKRFQQLVADWNETGAALREEEDRVEAMDEFLAERGAA